MNAKRLVVFLMFIIGITSFQLNAQTKRQELENELARLKAENALLEQQNAALRNTSSEEKKEISLENDNSERFPKKEDVDKAMKEIDDFIETVDLLSEVGLLPNIAPIIRTGKEYVTKDTNTNQLNLTTHQKEIVKTNDNMIFWTSLISEIPIFNKIFDALAYTTTGTSWKEMNKTAKKGFLKNYVNKSNKENEELRKALERISQVANDVYHEPSTESVKPIMP